MPFESTRLLHPGFHAAVQGSAVGDLGMPDTCTITQPDTGAGSVDASGNWTPDLPATVYTGGCRAQARLTDRTVDQGDEQVTLHPYLVAVPAAADQIVVDALVTVDTSDDDLLAGRTLIVRSVHYTAFQARRLLLCDDHPQNETSGG